MPLVTEIKRNGEVLEIPWSYFHLSCMYTAAYQEAVPDEIATESGKTWKELEEDNGFVDFSMTPIYYLDAPKVGLVKNGRQTLKRDHEFQAGEVIFELKKGDVLRAWREHKSE